MTTDKPTEFDDGNSLVLRQAGDMGIDASEMAIRLREHYELATGQTIDDFVALISALERVLKDAGIEVQQ